MEIRVGGARTAATNPSTTQAEGGPNRGVIGGRRTMGGSMLSEKKMEKTTGARSEKACMHILGFMSRRLFCPDTVGGCARHESQVKC